MQETTTFGGELANILGSIGTEEDSKFEEYEGGYEIEHKGNEEKDFEENVEKPPIPTFVVPNSSRTVEYPPVPPPDPPEELPKPKPPPPVKRGLPPPRPNVPA